MLEAQCMLSYSGQLQVHQGGNKSEKKSAPTIYLINNFLTKHPLWLSIAPGIQLVCLSRLLLFFDNFRADHWSMNVLALR
jgi:hypothetical protein